MGRIAQAGFNKTTQQHIENLYRLDKEAEAIKDKQIWALNETIAALEKRIEALEAKRGPGRPKVERDTTSDDRKV
jgi:polyhydroxyalkanoate synthesis regulator phasin